MKKYWFVIHRVAFVLWLTTKQYHNIRDLESSISTMSFNEYFIRSALWPAIIFTIIMMIIGAIGNTLIIYIYRNHFHKSVPWLFIYVLSIFDLLACGIAMPSELVVLSTFTAFPSAILCKLSRYLSFTFHGCSCVILMAIALNRYEKVCRPNKQFLSLRRAKMFCVVTVVFACVSYIPCFLIYGEFVFPVVKKGDDVKILPYDFNITDIVTMNLTSNDVFEGKFCTITKEANKGIVLGFYVFQFFLYSMLVVLIIFFYSRVICTMKSYSQKQKELLCQMGYQAQRTDHIRVIPTLQPKEELTGDFSRDYSQNEAHQNDPKRISIDAMQCTNQDNTMDDKKQLDKTNAPTAKDEKPNNASLRIQISPPILEENENIETLFMRQGISENNIHFSSIAQNSPDPMETNKLLIRRFKSSDDFKCHVSQLQILPPVDPYDAIFEPLFLHAQKTQKKTEKNSVRKSKKGRSKSVSRSKSNADISLRMVKPNKRDENAKSLEGLATLYCRSNSTNTNTTANNNNDNANVNLNSLYDGTVTLTRRTTPRGSKNCIIPISTSLSVKSAVSYNVLDPGEPDLNSELKNTNDNTSANTIHTEKSNSNDKLDNTNDTNYEETKDESLDVQDTQIDTDDCPAERRDTVSFKKAVTVIHGPNNIVGVQMRRRSESTSNTPNRNSENVLTPSPRQQVDYRRRQSVRPIRANRTSRILFWISLAFVLSFLPFWIIVFIRTFVGPNIQADASNVEIGFMSVLIRFTLISNAINPLIYGLMNSQFRHRCSDVFRWSKKGVTHN